MQPAPGCLSASEWAPLSLRQTAPVLEVREFWLARSTSSPPGIRDPAFQSFHCHGLARRDSESSSASAGLCGCSPRPGSPVEGEEQQKVGKVGKIRQLHNF